MEQDSRVVEEGDDNCHQSHISAEVESLPIRDQTGVCQEECQGDANDSNAKSDGGSAKDSAGERLGEILKVKADWRRRWVVFGVLPQRGQLNEPLALEMPQKLLHVGPLSKLFLVR